MTWAEQSVTVLGGIGLLTFVVILVLVRMFGVPATTRIMVILAGALWTVFFAVCFAIEYTPGLSSQYRSVEFSSEMKAFQGRYYVSEAESLWQTYLGLAASAAGFGWVGILMLAPRRATAKDSRSPDEPTEIADS